MRITIIEENGFKKQIEIKKAVTRIGSSSLSDIQLHSARISPFHLQVFYTQDAPDRCKIINLAAETVNLVSDEQETPLAAYASAEVLAGDELHIAAFRLRFELPLVSGTLVTSQKISASVALPESVLRPNATLLGRISLKNEGENKSCQFHVEISGFPEDCIQIDPVPLIYAGGQEDVNIRFFHRQTHPAAGFQSVTISISAPESYPGEQVSIQQGLYVMPMLEQRLVIRDDVPESQPVTNITEAATSKLNLTAKEVKAESSQTADIPAPVEPLTDPETSPPKPQPEPILSVTPIPVQEEPVPALDETASSQQDAPPPPARSLPANAKVVRTPAESFWDE